MSLLGKLVIREISYHRARMGLTLFAIIATCCLMVWFVGSFDVMRNEFLKDAKHYLGEYDVVIVSPRGNLHGVLLDSLKEDSSIMRKDLAFQTPCNAARGVTDTASLDKVRLTMGTPQMNPMIMGLDTRMNPFEIEEGRWFNPDSPEIECVVSTASMKILKSRGPSKKTDGTEVPEEMQLGEMVDINTASGHFQARIVGIVKQGGEYSGFSGGSMGGRRMPPKKDVSVREEPGKGGPKENRIKDEDGGVSLSGTGMRRKENAAMDGGKQEFTAESGEKYLHEGGSDSAVPGGSGSAMPGGSGSAMPGGSGSAMPGGSGSAMPGGSGSAMPGGPGSAMPGGPNGFRPGGVRENLPPGMGGVISPQTASVYVSLENARKIAGTSGLNMVFIKLQNDTPTKFRETWEKKNAEYDWGATFVDVDTIKKEMTEGQASSAILTQAWSAIGLVLLAALFIIFTTLSMGVNERIRQLAMLRTLGLTRGQVASLFILEGLMLGLLGWIGGLTAGWLMLQVLVMLNTSMTTTTVVLSPLCIGIALGVSLIGSLAASIIPAWRATRIAPLEAMVRSSGKPAGKGVVFSALLGIIILVLIALVVEVFPLDNKLRAILVSTGGNVLAATAFLLIAPLLIVVMEYVIGPVVSILLGLSPAFLANQLSCNKWRTLGTTVSLSLGLGLYTMIQIWGYSMLGPFLPSRDLPTALVAFLPAGIPDSEIENVRNVKGVFRDQFMPLALEQPPLDVSMLAAEKDTGMLSRQMNNVCMFGVDPKLAFQGKTPMIRLSYVSGTASDVSRAMNEPGNRVCVIPDMLASRFKLKLGDTLRLNIPPQGVSVMSADVSPADLGRLEEAPRVSEKDGMLEHTHKKTAESHSEEREIKKKGSLRTVEYKIVGIAKIPGWHWITKTSGVRTQSGRTAGLVLAPYAEVKKDFHLNRNGFFWMNTQPGVTQPYLEGEMQKIAARSAGVDAVSSDETIHLAQTARGLRQGFAKVSTYDSILASIGTRANSVIQQMAQMPLIILIITTIAVINTMMASVRTRRWEMGILRAYGVTRAGLIRLIIAEGILVGLCACALSFSFGLFTAWACKGVSGFSGFLGGVTPPMVIPWGRLCVGFGITVVICILASLIPAFQAGREEPSALLVRKD